MINQGHLTEDTVSQSGWVFADLLVALSVIFLATISFVPLKGPEGNSSASSLNIESGKLFRATGFTMVYDSISVENLLSDLENFRIENGIPKTIPVIHIQFIGSSNIEEERSGILDALEFSVRLQNSNLEDFQDAGISLDVSNKIEPGQVMVRAVFGASKN